MNASRPAPLRSIESRRPHRPRRRASSQERLDRMTQWETGFKIAADVTISLGAILALVRLVPSLTTSRTQLQKLETEVESTRERVEILQADFGRYFDPKQARILRQEQTQLVDPFQQRVVWVEGEEIEK
ncbi:MAG: hypothetical protein J7641_23135 [Cyanobacteria bacterium SID2]|nr:hypothetical protein [Cyanobacteria bacterium SID2]MBP0003925.1 hypothetical protein [Cyanobacteria bacterium SBC]